MNHCVDCGKRVTTGGTQRNASQRRCLLCLQAKVMATLPRFVSPAMRRKTKREA